MNPIDDILDQLSLGAYSDAVEITDRVMYGLVRLYLDQMAVQHVIQWRQQKQCKCRTPFCDRAPLYGEIFATLQSVQPDLRDTLHRWAQMDLEKCDFILTNSERRESLTPEAEANVQQKRACLREFLSL